MKHLLTLLLLLIVLDPISANPIHFNRLNVSNGLSSNEVTSIYKDKKGFMWFGANAELNRYDGYEFKQYKHLINGEAYSEEIIKKIIETQDSHLLVVYQNELISVYNPEKNGFITGSDYFKSLGFTGEVYSAYPDSELNLLFSTIDQRLFRYSFETQEFIEYPIDKHESQICDVYSTKNKLYVIYNSGVIDVIQQSLKKRQTRISGLEKLTKALFYKLMVDEDEDLWVYLDNRNSDGLYRYVPSSGEWIHYSTKSVPALSSSLILSLTTGSDGKIWIGTDHGGINILDKRTNEIRYVQNNPFDERSVSQNTITCLYRDDTGMVWAGTFKEAINYYHESIIKFDCVRYPIATADEVEMNDCNCVVEDKSGNLWIGTNGNGLLCYQPDTRKYKVYKHNPNDSKSISSDIVISLAFDADDNLWIGTYVGGLDRFDGKQFYHYKSEKQEKEIQSLSNTVFSIFPDSYGYLWLGTMGNGLQCLNLTSGEWKRFIDRDSTKGLTSDFIFNLTKGRQDSLFIGTSYGVSVLNLKNHELTLLKTLPDTVKPWFADKVINTIYQDSHYLLWIGTNNGLYVYDPENEKEYILNKSTGLGDEHIQSIIEDENYALWIGSKNGLLQIAPQLREEQKYHFSCSIYNENEGIQGRVFNRNSVTRTSKNHFIFGGTNGLSVFNPSTIKYNHNIPSVIMTDFICQNTVNQPFDLENVSYKEECTLTYDQRSFYLTLSSLNYFLPQKNKFEYKLEGFDNQWIKTDAANRTITYTNLLPGQYTLFVKAVNNDGVSSRKPFVFKINILPPFWATTWAIVLYILLAVFLAFLIIKRIIKIQQKKFIEKQDLILAGQMHEMDQMKLRFFTNISHEFRTPLTLILTPIEQMIQKEECAEKRQMLQLVYRNAEQLLQLVNQLLDFRKIDVQGVKLLLSSGDIVIYVKNITYSFKLLAEQKQIHLDFNSEIAELNMQFDTDKIFKIVSNLLSNAFKFTSVGGTIEVSVGRTCLKSGVDGVFIRVTDSGIGIASDKQAFVFDRFFQVQPDDEQHKNTGTGIGLHLCREFVKLHNGSIELVSKPGEGSSFTVYLPLKPDTSLVDQQVDSSVVNTSINEQTAEIRLTDEESGSDESNVNPVLLLVDDNPDFLNFISSDLSSKYNIITAVNGQEAWNKVQSVFPDIVISDIMMPVMDGIELCRLIKQDIRTSHIPVILLTAKSGEESKLTGLESGADDYIGKPFNMHALLLKIEHLINMREKIHQQFIKNSRPGIELTSVAVSSMDQNLLEKAVRIIEEQIQNPALSVEWLSREMGMSRVNFYKKILSLTGKTPIELIRFVRLKRAAMLLENGQKRINEVASDSGFNDIKLFRKYFKEEFGVLPSEYTEKR